MEEDEHVAMVLDQAGWHGAAALRIPANITLVPLPPYSPELNPVERVWLHLKERFLSHRLHANYDAIADAASQAWDRLVAEAGRLSTLCSYPWIPILQSRLRLFPCHHRPGSHVPHQSLIELRAAHTPDVARPVSGHRPS
ncbi:MAG: transposase [Hyphomicrobiaceae bacterium]